MPRKKKEENKEEQNIINKDYHEEIEEDILNYSLSAIVRAIPSAKDGLKPIARRICYIMKTEHSTYDKPYKKSAKTTGLVLARVHPHGLN